MEEKKFQVDITQIDKEGEFLLTSLNEGANVLDIEPRIKEFIKKNNQICSFLIKTLEFKNCYFIYKKMEKVLVQVLKLMQEYHCAQFPICNIMLSIIEYPPQPSKVELKPIMLNKVELYSAPYPEGKKLVYDLMDYILKNLILCINNGGVVYMMRNKCEVALSNLLRGLFGRLIFQHDYLCIHQLSVLMVNSAFCFKNLDKYEEAGQLMNKAIITQEYLEKIMQQNGGVLKGVVESSTNMLNLIEFLFNKNDQVFDDVSMIEHERLIYNLSINYKYYGEILTKQKRQKEAEFCLEQSKSLYKKFKKSLARTQQSQIQNQTKQEIPQGILKQQQKMNQINLGQNLHGSEFESLQDTGRQQMMYQNSKLSQVELEKKLSQQQQKQEQQQNESMQFQNQTNNDDMKQSQSKQQNSYVLTQKIISTNFPKQINQKNNDPERNFDNFSKASFQTLKTNTTLGGQSFLAKENIIFKKYMYTKLKLFVIYTYFRTVGDTRYKIVIVQIKEFHCCQILLYNKPQNQMKKLVVGLLALRQFAKKTNQEQAFANEKTLNIFFKEVTKKLYIEDNDLKLKEIEYFETVEQFMKMSKNSPNQQIAQQ